MTNVAVVSGDIISSTCLTQKNKDLVRGNLPDLCDLIEKLCKGSYVRITKGDYMECYLPEAEKSLRIALLIKCFIKSLDIRQQKNKLRFKYFSAYGMRLAVGVGSMTKVDRKNDVLDGEAIYLAGRLLDRYHTSDKGKVVLKNTLYFVAAIPEWQEEFEPVFALLDVLLAKLTAKQCKVVFYKLQGLNDEEIAGVLDKKRTTINEHSTLAGWNAIERVIARFESVVKA